MNGITRAILSLSLLGIGCPLVLGDQPPATQLLEKAIYTEQTVGDLESALQIYHQIVKQHQKNEKVAAEAQLHIGLIHLKLGQNDQATKVLERLASEYPGQKRLLQKVRGKMPPVIDEAIEHIRAYYVDEIDDDAELTEAALRGVLGNLDPYSSYIDADALENLMIGTNGKLAGIGAVLDFQDSRVVVKTPIHGSPAKAAGLAAGDTIVSVDGVSLDGFAEDDRMGEALKRIRGKAGDDVTVGILPADSKETKTVTVTRGEIKIDSVSGTHREDNEQWHYRLAAAPQIGYVRISSLTRETPRDFRRVAKRLQSEGVQGLIIDLRSNGGGLMNATVEVADMLLTDGEILEVRGRSDDTKTYEADPAELLAGVPIAILVNHKTASAAEILAGSLKDRGRATVIGQRTYGKGTVQALFRLDSGGAIKLTTARFYLPSGDTLEKPSDPGPDDSWGVNPNDGFLVNFLDEEVKAFEEMRSAVETFGQPNTSQKEVTDRGLDRAMEFLKTQQHP